MANQSKDNQNQMILEILVGLACPEEVECDQKDLGRVIDFIVDSEFPISLLTEYLFGLNARAND